MSLSKKIHAVSFALFIVVAGVFVPHTAEATTVTATINNIGASTPLYYFWNCSGTCKTDTGWQPGLGNATVNVNYQVAVSDQTTGATLNQTGDTVNVGDSLLLFFYPHVSNDISWFGTGYTNDSPYGTWTTGTTYSPPTDSSGKVECNANDLVQANVPTSDQVCNSIAAYPGGPLITTCSYDYFDVYAPLLIQPPTETLSNIPSNLSCGPLQPGIYGIYVASCTVTGAGVISPKFNISATQGEFFYRYYGTLEQNTSSGVQGVTGCYGNNTPMGTQGAAGNTYTLPVPAKAVSYSFTAVVPNDPPNAPTITGPTTGLTGTAYNFSVKATDPNSDNVDYGMDSTNNGTVDSWLPASGYDPSGTAETYTRLWNTPGTYTFAAKTRDDKGAVSGWTTHTITITQAPKDPTATLTCPTSVVKGVAPTLKWSSTDATSCTATAGPGFSTGGSPSGTDKGTAITTNQKYAISCTGAAGTTAATDSCIVSAVTPTGSISASPNPCDAIGATGTCESDLTWNTTGSTAAQVNVSQDGGAEQLFDTGTSQTADPATWIQPNHTYVFNLYDKSTGSLGALLDSVTVTANALLPDLTGVTGPATTTSPKQTVWLAGTVKNIGKATTGKVFYNDLQVAKSDKTTIIEDNPVVAPILAANGSEDVGNQSGNDFPTPGTYYYRLCADENGNRVGSVQESNENNNCGSWSPITVTYPPVTGSCEVSPVSGYPYQTYTWQAVNVSGGDGTNYTYSWSGNDPAGPTGSTAAVQTIYTTTGTKTGKVTIMSGGNATTVDCSTSPGGDPNTGPTTNLTACLVSLSADKTSIDYGDTVKLTWGENPAKCAPICVFSDTQSVNRGSSGSRNVIPPQPTTVNQTTGIGTDTYSVSCPATSTQTGTVNIAVAVPTATISVSPNRVRPGSGTTVTWGSNNIDNCTVYKNGQSWQSGLTPTPPSRSVNGSVPDTGITTQTLYQIQCTNNSGNSVVAQAQATVNVIPGFQEF